MSSCLKPTKLTRPQRTALPHKIAATELYDCELDQRPIPPCNERYNSGGRGITRTRVGLGPDAGTVVIEYHMRQVPDLIECRWNGILVATSLVPVSGDGELTWEYDPEPGDPLWCLITVTGRDDNTIWSYTVHCPV